MRRRNSSQNLSRLKTLHAKCARFSDVEIGGIAVNSDAQTKRQRSLLTVSHLTLIQSHCVPDRYRASRRLDTYVRSANASERSRMVPQRALPRWPRPTQRAATRLCHVRSYDAPHFVHIKERSTRRSSVHALATGTLGCQLTSPSVRGTPDTGKL